MIPRLFPLVLAALVWGALVGAPMARAQTVNAPRNQTGDTQTGDTWTYDITVANRTGWHQRVDAEGVTTMTQVNRARPAVVSGRTHKSIWCVPAVQRWVRAVEEYHDARGRRNERYEDALDLHKVSG